MRSGEGFWRALATARRRNLADAGEAAPVAASPAATRRALLRGFAMSGVAAAVPSAAPAHVGGGKVAVIGGGIAGLSALHHLRENGVDADLFEAGKRLGGRIFTLHHPGGISFEMGAQLVNSDQHDIRALCAAFGLPLVDRKAQDHHMLVLAGGKAVVADELADALRPIAEQIGKDADRIDRDPAALRELDSISVAAYLDRHADLIPRPWVRGLLEASGRSEYGAEPDAASALTLAFNLPTVNGARVDVLGGSDERYVIEGGSSALIAAIAARHAAHVHRGKRLTRIEPATGGVRLRFADGGTARVDTLVLAVPAPVTRHIDIAVPLPRAWRQFIGSMSLGRNEKLLMATADPHWRDAIGTGGEIWQTDGPYASGWDGSVRTKQGDRGAVWTWYHGGAESVDRVPVRDLAARYAQGVAPVMAGMDRACNGPVRRTGWHRNPLIRGSYGSYAPGYLSRFGGLLWMEGEDGAAVQNAPALGRVVLAGEHLSDAFPGYMNGGAQTGRLAAQAILGRTIRLQTA